MIEIKLKYVSLIEVITVAPELSGDKSVSGAMHHHQPIVTFKVPLRV